MPENKIGTITTINCMKMLSNLSDGLTAAVIKRINYYIFYNYIFIYNSSEGNPYIYDVLDWRNVGKSSGTLIGTLFLACFVHIVLFFIYRLRVTIHERCCSRDNKSSKGSATQIGISMVLGNHGNDNPGYINTEKVV